MRIRIGTREIRRGDKIDAGDRSLIADHITEIAGDSVFDPTRRKIVVSGTIAGVPAAREFFADGLIAVDRPPVIDVPHGGRVFRFDFDSLREFLEGSYGEREWCLFRAAMQRANLDGLNDEGGEA